MQNLSEHFQSRRRILLGLGTLMAMLLSKIPAATPVPENVEWVLIEMNGKAVEAADNGGGEATLKLDAAKKCVDGKSFVNQYGGSYELKDGTLKFGRLMSTLMASTSEALNAAEQEYTAMLGKVTGWRIADGKLELLAADKIVAKFVERAAAKK